MGSLGGHLVPGSIFIIIGLWWIYSTWLRYFSCRQRRRTFYITTSFPCHCCGSRISQLPIESFFVIFGTILGILIELIAGFNRTYDPITHHSSFYEGANNLQHFAMYFMFLLTGIIQLLLHYNFPLPKQLDIVAGCLAFSSEAFLFYFHGHARDPVEVEIHIFLVLAISPTVICGVFELIQQEKTSLCNINAWIFYCFYKVHGFIQPVFFFIVHFMNIMNKVKIQMHIVQQCYLHIILFFIWLLHYVFYLFYLYQLI